MHLKMSSGKWRPFYLGLNVLAEYVDVRWVERMDGDVEGVRHCVIEREVVCYAGISIIVSSYLVIYQRLINSLRPSDAYMRR